LSSLEQALAGRLSDWEGLDPGLTEESLGALLGSAYDTWPRQPARLAGQFVTNREWRREGERPQVVRAWFEGEAPEVLMVDLEEPPADLDPDEIPARWGPPDREEPGRRYVPDGWTTELVYLGRGAALTVVRPFENDPSFPQFEPRIAVAQLFEPTDLQGFIVRYGGNDRPGPSHPLP
jgi:hypothetical protein